MDMSLRITFHSCGSSSIENFRNHLPITVMRGSFGILNTISRLFICATSAFNSSAFSTIDRNL